MRGLKSRDLMLFALGRRRHSPLPWRCPYCPRLGSGPARCKTSALEPDTFPHPLDATVPDFGLLPIQLCTRPWLAHAGRWSGFSTSREWLAIHAHPVSAARSARSQSDTDTATLARLCSTFVQVPSHRVRGTTARQ